MSWFLPLNPRKPKRGRGGSRKTKRHQPWDPARTVRGLKMLAVIGAVAVVVLGGSRLIRELNEYESMRYSRLIQPDDIEIRNCPLWMSPSLEDEIKLLIAGYLSADPHDRESLCLATSVLSDSPWVSQVHQLRRLRDGRIEVFADYRRPVALVVDHAGLRLIDREGVLLPGVYSRDQLDQIGLPVITGVNSIAPTQPGEYWSGDDLQAAVMLVELLECEPYADQIIAYDAGERDSSGLPRLKLYTNHGMVRWGLPPGYERTREPDYAVKIRWLRQVAATRGSIDAGGKIVDIFGTTIQIVHPSQEG